MQGAATGQPSSAHSDERPRTSAVAGIGAAVQAELVRSTVLAAVAPTMPQPHSLDVLPPPCVFVKGTQEMGMEMLEMYAGMEG